MSILSIDPGTEQSGYLVLVDGRIVQHGVLPNDELLGFVQTAAWQFELLAIEMVASYGMPVGKEVFETCVWIGRFIERWTNELSGPVELVYRTDVKMHFCHTLKKVKDTHIRQAIIDQFGPGKEKAIGTKAHPGPLYGITSHEWSALAVALYAEHKVSERLAA